MVASLIRWLAQGFLRIEARKVKKRNKKIRNDHNMDRKACGYFTVLITKFVSCT
jgi:hypothetical protein